MLREDLIHSSDSKHDRLERQPLVGREWEIRFFEEQLAASQFQWRIVNVHGTSGIGKSSLLEEFCHLSQREQVRFVLLDCRVSPRNAAACER